MRSNEVLSAVKRLYRANKAGHTGSLDRPATGILPICFGRATKVSGYLLNENKRYLARFQLGSTTTTGDAEGELVKKYEIPMIEAELVNDVTRSFLGPSKQIPPMFSALKQNGKRLHQLAYQGIEVERQPRPITIHEFILKELGADYLDFEISCSKGTYIRTLAEDFANKLGTGGHISYLKRIGVGPFSYQSHPIYKLGDIKQTHENQNHADLLKLLLDIDQGLVSLPLHMVDSAGRIRLCQGQKVQTDNRPISELVRLYDEKNVFFGIGEISKLGEITPKNIFS